MLSKGGMTDREITLYSSILAVLSMAISWVITDFYSEMNKNNALKDAKDFYKDNLRTYVINASEKVNNMSNELNRLSCRLKEIDSNYNDSSTIELIVIREKVASTTYIIEALKAINDTTINDWRGVIDEDIKTFRETEEESKRNEINNLLLRIENLEAINSEDEGAVESEKNVRKRLEELLSDTGIVLNEYKKIQHVTRRCPRCKTNIGYDQHTRSQNTRVLKCSTLNCNSLLISEYDNENNKFTLIAPKLITRTEKCFICKNQVKANVPDYENVPAKALCTCGNELIFKQSNGEILVIQTNHGNQPKIEITEELICNTKCLLPEQPWEKNIHKVVAKELGIPNKIVQSITWL